MKKKAGRPIKAGASVNVNTMFQNANRFLKAIDQSGLSDTRNVREAKDIREEMKDYLTKSGTIKKKSSKWSKEKQQDYDRKMKKAYKFYSEGQGVKGIKQAQREILQSFKKRGINTEDLKLEGVLDYIKHRKELSNSITDYLDSHQIAIVISKRGTTDNLNDVLDYYLMKNAGKVIRTDELMKFLIENIKV